MGFVDVIIVYSSGFPQGPPAVRRLGLLAGLGGIAVFLGLTGYCPAVCLAICVRRKGLRTCARTDERGD